MSDAGLSRDLAKTQEHDDTEYCQHVWRKDSAERSELGSLARSLVSRGAHELSLELCEVSSGSTCDFCTYGTPCSMAISANVSSRPR